MDIFIPLLVLYIAFKMPWSNDFLIGAGLLMSIASLIYLSMVIVDRLIVRRKITHRMEIKAPLSPLDAAIKADGPPYPPPENDDGGDGSETPPPR